MTARPHLHQSGVTLIRCDQPDFIGYDVYRDRRHVGHIRRRATGGREWTWCPMDASFYVGFLPRRKDAVQMLLDVVSEAA